MIAALAVTSTSGFLTLGIAGVITCSASFFSETGFMIATVFVSDLISIVLGCLVDGWFFSTGFALVRQQLASDLSL